jgi:hypothetical protein
MRFCAISAVIAFGLVCFSGALRAAPLEYDVLFSGSSPAGPAPWLTAAFSDAEGGVTLTLSTDGLSPGEFVGKKGWYFNFNDDKIDVLDDLQFTHVSGNAADRIDVGVDGFKADGGGYYDLRFAWNNRPAARLGEGMTVVYRIDGVEGLTASDFIGYLSAPSGGQGEWWSAAHVQGIQGGGSGWVAAIPEPATVTLAGLGVLAAAFWAGRRRRR